MKRLKQQFPRVFHTPLAFLNNFDAVKNHSSVSVNQQSYDQLSFDQLSFDKLSFDQLSHDQLSFDQQKE